MKRLSDQHLEVQKKQGKLQNQHSKKRELSDKVSVFLEGIEQYKFNLDDMPTEQIMEMNREEVLAHLYNILLDYIESDETMTLCNVFVLYGVIIFQ